MNQTARNWSLLATTLALFIVLLTLFDWMLFLIVPLPLTIPIALAASFLVRRETVSTVSRARRPIRLASYLSTVGCLVASVICWGVWMYSWKYGEAGAPAEIERAIDLSFAVAVIALGASVWCAALTLTVKPISTSGHTDYPA